MSMKKLFTVTMLMLFGVIVNSQNSVYQLTLTSPGAEEVSGQAVIYINGNPIEVLAEKEGLVEIDKWLKKGSNTITIIGDFGGDIKVQVQTRKRTLMNYTIPQDDLAEGHQADFEADIDYKLPIFKKKGEFLEEDKPLEEDSIIAKIKVIRKGLKNTKYEKAINELNKGLSIWGEMTSTFSEAEIKAGEDEMIEIFQKEPPVLEPIDWGSLVFIWGENTVIVYTENDDNKGTSYLFEFGANGETMPPLTFAKIDDEWMVW